MNKRERLRFLLRMIPALLGWAALMLLIWVFVFLRLDDADGAHKLVIYTDAYVFDARGAMIALEDESGISGDKPYVFQEDGLQKIKLHPSTYRSMGGSIFQDGDIFIISEESLTQTDKALFAVIPTQAFEGYEIRDGVALPIKGLDTLKLIKPFVSFDPNTTY